MWDINIGTIVRWIGYYLASNKPKFDPNTLYGLSSQSEVILSIEPGIVLNTIGYAPPPPPK